MKRGILSLGEALVDFIPLDDDNTNYQKSPGGAPANVAVGVARLGLLSTFIGKVGDDVLGHFLMETLTGFNVNTNNMILTPEVRTGVVFVTNNEDGERSFDFYINPSADWFLHKDEINTELFKESKILHFGSISMISNPAKDATKCAIKLAKENGMMVSYDPNLRMALWDSEEQARDTIMSVLNEVDVLKVSEEELSFLSGETDMESGIEQLRKTYDIPLILVTLGSEGSYVHTTDDQAHIPAMNVKAIDTTGAGDAFVSAFLYSLHQYQGEVQSITIEEVTQMAQFASVSGALAASTKGAMTALPTLKEVSEILDGR
ncbi:aminoimidazole riboside kinase [Pseudalkalibacillus sp. Hm43]|uniref:aminoimidazole riboside kinase n=1 Tax=Pseudalkalibacillus sp. Hm43 TaxID=3450742 RepID=UPI003F41C48A